MPNLSRPSASCEFPEYGSGGDSAGARRLRHSFRLCVFACLAITFMLWFSERYLRYDLPESQYIAALTLEPESARAMLRQVVKRDAATHESPTPKYLAALAEREEADLVLPTYERAVTADPNNPFTAMRYGCRLFMAERFADASAQFQRADALPPRNAWPAYLQAAAMPFIKPEAETDLGESLALISKANSGGQPFLIPLPLWTSAMPERGIWYERLRRSIADEFCAPLYRYADLVMRQARHAIAIRQIQSWDSWLETLQVQGERIAQSADLQTERGAGGCIQATAGIHIQIMALDERQALRTQQGATPDPALDQRRRTLNTALSQLNAFEDTRDRRITTDTRRYTLPLHLCWQTAGILMLFYMGAYALCALMRVHRVSWTLRHPRFGIHIIAGGQLLLLLQLALMAFLQHHHVSFSLLAGLRAVWWVSLAGLVFLGPLYPHLLLPAYKTAAANWQENLRRRRELDKSILEGADPAQAPAYASQESETSILRAARGARRVAYVAFLRRYYGVLLGLFFCTISCWAIAYRIATAIYPWQLSVLVTGLGAEEAEVVHRVISLLTGSGS